MTQHYFLLLFIIFLLIFAFQYNWYLVIFTIIIIYVYYFYFYNYQNKFLTESFHQFGPILPNTPNIININKIYCIKAVNGAQAMRFINSANDANLLVSSLPSYNGRPINKGWLFKSNLLQNIALSESAISRFYDHIRIWKMITQHNDRNVLILENTCTLPQNFMDNFYKSTQHIPTNWDIIFLAGATESIWSPDGSKAFKLYPHGSPRLNTFAYLINVKSAYKLLKHIYPIVQTFDDTIWEYSSTNLNAYYVYPSII